MVLIKQALQEKFKVEICNLYHTNQKTLFWEGIFYVLQNNFKSREKLSDIKVV